MAGSRTLVVNVVAVIKQVVVAPVAQARTAVVAGRRRSGKHWSQEQPYASNHELGLKQHTSPPHVDFSLIRSLAEERHTCLKSELGNCCARTQQNNSKVSVSQCRGMTENIHQQSIRTRAGVQLFPALIP